MEQATLHWLRLITPGVLAAMAYLTVAFPNLDGAAIKSFLTDLEVFGMIPFLFIGYPYRVLNLRKIVLGDFWVSVNTNIADRLLAIVQKHSPLTPPQEQYLRSGGHLMDVFYRVVDSDPTLTARTSGVYFNGYLTTLGVDVMIVALITAAIHLLCWMTGSQLINFLWVAGLCTAAALAHVVLVRRSIQGHKDLSNEQLRFIASFHAATVCDSVKSILSGMPTDPAQQD